MEHASYAAGGTDFDTEVYCPFKTVKEVYNFDAWAKTDCKIFMSHDDIC